MKRFELSLYCTVFRKPELWKLNTSRACSSLIPLINIFGISDIPHDVKMHEDLLFRRMTESACWLHKPDKLRYFVEIVTEIVEKSIAYTKNMYENRHIKK